MICLCAPLSFFCIRAQTGTFASRATQNFSTVERACRELGLADDGQGHGALTFSQFAGNNTEQRKHIVQFLLALKQRLGDEITPSELSSSSSNSAVKSVGKPSAMVVAPGSQHHQSSSSSSSSSSAPCNRNLFASPAPAANAPKQELMLQPAGETPDMAMDEGTVLCAAKQSCDMDNVIIRARIINDLASSKLFPAF